MSQRRRHRGLFWAAVLLAVIAFTGGGIAAYAGYSATSDPATVVSDYFAALEDANAPAALGYGELPAGSSVLLTSTALRAQRRIAPIRHVQVLAVDRTGDTARVSVRYQLDFAGGLQQVVDTVPVRERNGVWRLAASAVAVHLDLNAARERATMLGGPLPTGTTLLFPGAVPISFDTPYLRLRPSTSYVRFASERRLKLHAEASPAGRAALSKAVRHVLQACFAASAGPGAPCPLPSDRYVPGSLHGAVSALRPDKLTITLTDSAAGLLQLRGQLTFTGRYRKLDYDNVAVAGSGSVPMHVSARSYAVAPIEVQWTDR